MFGLYTSNYDFVIKVSIFHKEQEKQGDLGLNIKIGKKNIVFSGGLEAFKP